MQLVVIYTWSLLTMLVKLKVNVCSLKINPLFVEFHVRWSWHSSTISCICNVYIYKYIYGHSSYTVFTAPEGEVWLSMINAWWPWYKCYKSCTWLAQSVVTFTYTYIYSDGPWPCQWLCLELHSSRYMYYNNIMYRTLTSQINSL